MLIAGPSTNLTGSAAKVDGSTSVRGFFVAASSWLLRDFFVACAWLLRGFFVASSWLLRGFFVTSSWLLRGFLVGSSWPLLKRTWLVSSQCLRGANLACVKFKFKLHEDARACGEMHISLEI